MKVDQFVDGRIGEGGTRVEDRECVGFARKAT